MKFSRNHVQIFSEVSHKLNICQFFRQEEPHYYRMIVTHAVEIKGFEPLTPCLQGRCSPN